MRRDVAEAVLERSGGRCEAVWDDLRCMEAAEQIHHRLPKSRGGRILEEAGDTTNLVHLCGWCHGSAHAQQTRARALDAPLVVPGSVLSGRDGRPVYRGSYKPFQHLFPADEDVA